MNDLQWRMELNSADARYQAAMLTMESDLSHGAVEAGTDRAQVEYLKAEANRARARIENAELRSPIQGIVMTPNLQNLAGQHLVAGDTFAQVLDLSSAVVDIAIPQSEAALLRSGQPAVIKLDSYPQRSWRGTVAIVSPQAQAGDGQRTFAARVPLPNADGTLRWGMTDAPRSSLAIIRRGTCCCVDRPFGFGNFSGTGSVGDAYECSFLAATFLAVCCHCRRITMDRRLRCASCSGASTDLCYAGAGCVCSSIGQGEPSDGYEGAGFRAFHDDRPVGRRAAVGHRGTA
jgi:hypothetical protein